MAAQARSDRSLRLVLSGASADVTLVISDAAERPLASMVVPPDQLRDIVQSFGSMLALIEGDARSGALPSTAGWQTTGVVFDEPAWRVAQEPATGVVVLSLQAGPSASWSFALSPEEARRLGRSLGEAVGGEPPPAEAPPEEPIELPGGTA
jgi:hypothetical protein